MATWDEARRTRRSVLSGAIGALIGTAAAALGRPTAALAANGDHVVAGGSVTGTGTTKVASTVAGAGTAAVLGEASNAATAATGVLGLASAATERTAGVVGLANSGRGVGVRGIAADPGSYGFYPLHRVGVYGYAKGGDDPLLAFAVHGQSDVGHGVRGTATTGKGVSGWTDSGMGVDGGAISGIGIRASSSTGPALEVLGRAHFSRAGRAIVGANATYVDVTVPGGIKNTTNVLATLQTYRPGVWVTAARLNYPSANKVRIYLNKVASTTASTYIAWFAFG